MLFTSAAGVSSALGLLASDSPVNITLNFRHDTATWPLELAGAAYVLNVRSDKHIHPPHDLFGGQSASPARNIVESDGESWQLSALLDNPTILNKNNLFRYLMAGGGGYGNPLD